MIQHLFLIPHHVLMLRLAVVHGVVGVALLGIIVFVRLKVPSFSRMISTLILITLFMVLAALHDYFYAFDPLHHPSSLTSQFDLAGSVVAAFAVIMFLLNWRRFKQDTRRNSKNNAAAP